jgi:hypothetical protein
MSRRVNSPDDTVSSWTNRRKDLCVICPAAATAGFCFPAENCSSTGCSLIDEFTPSNVSLVGLKRMSFTATNDLSFSNKINVGKCFPSDR